MLWARSKLQWALALVIRGRQIGEVLVATIGKGANSVRVAGHPRRVVAQLRRFRRAGGKILRRMRSHCFMEETRKRKHQTGCWSGLDLNFRAPSTAPPSHPSD